VLDVERCHKLNDGMEILVIVITGSYYWSRCILGVIRSAQFAVRCSWLDAAHWCSKRFVSSHFWLWQSWPFIVHDAWWWNFIFTGFIQ